MFLLCIDYDSELAGCRFEGFDTEEELNEWIKGHKYIHSLNWEECGMKPIFYIYKRIGETT